MYNLDLAKLHSACKFNLDVDDKTGKIVLHGACTLKDKKTGKAKTFTRSVDLTRPIAEITARLNEYDKRAVRDHRVNGWWSDHKGSMSDAYHRAVDVAQRVGENKIAQFIYQDIAPVAAPFIPGGSVALAATQQGVAVAHKVHDLIIRAKGGEEGAKDKLRNLKEMAENGHGGAAKAMDMAQVMIKLLKQRQAYQEDVSGWLYNRPYRDNLTALSLDKSSPLDAIRMMYNVGLGRGAI